MNFERDDNFDQTPQISGVPDGQFQVPRQSEYFAAAEIDPNAPPEYRSTIEQEPADFEEQDIINWQAQDLLIGEKSKMWYLYFGIAVVLLLVAAWFLMGGAQSWSFMLVVVISAVAIVATRSANHAKIINYALSTRGVYIGNDFYEYSHFKAFGVLREKQTYSIILKPKKRFSPVVSIYFPKENGEKITDIIGARLPMEEAHLDLIDKIIRKINL